MMIIIIIALLILKPVMPRIRMALHLEIHPELTSSDMSLSTSGPGHDHLLQWFTTHTLQSILNQETRTIFFKCKSVMLLNCSKPSCGSPFHSR